MIHSWCLTYYGFVEMYNDTYSSLQYYAEYFHYPKILSAAPGHPSPCLSPSPQPDLTVSIVLLFPGFHEIRIKYYVGFPD